MMMKFTILILLLNFFSVNEETETREVKAPAQAPTGCKPGSA